MHPSWLELDRGVQCCIGDEGRSLGNGVQTRFPNRLELHSLRVSVVSVKEKVGANPVRTWFATHQVRRVETNASELL